MSHCPEGGPGCEAARGGHRVGGHHDSGGEASGHEAGGHERHGGEGHDHQGSERHPATQQLSGTPGFGQQLGNFPAGGGFGPAGVGGFANPGGGRFGFGHGGGGTPGFPAGAPIGGIPGAVSYRFGAMGAPIR